MKKVLMLAVILLGLTACKQEFACECYWKQNHPKPNVESGLMYYELSNMKDESQAVAWCNEAQNEYDISYCTFIK